MIVYRLSKSTFKTDLSGKGAEIAGGRWNSVGVSMIYTSSSRALCVAEVAVHLPLQILPKGYYMIELIIPDNNIEIINPSSLAKNWKKNPPIQLTKQIGDDFIKAQHHLILKVPSAVVEGEYNFLINPIHSQIKQCKSSLTKPFQFDERLFKR